MLPIFQVVPIMWRAVRPSKVADMPARANSFWLPKGYEGLTFFGTILTPTQKVADLFNSGFSALKNHEMIHLRQAQDCGDSWVRFYVRYLWYSFRIWCFAGRRIRQRQPHAAYLLNPFEIEAYARMYDLNYLSRCEGGAREWRHYAKMSLEERIEEIKR